MNERYLTFGILVISTTLFFFATVVSNPIYALALAIIFFIAGCAVSVFSQRMHDSHLSRLLAFVFIAAVSAAIIGSLHPQLSYISFLSWPWHG